jgi:hypothetical protein
MQRAGPQAAPEPTVAAPEADPATVADEPDPDRFEHRPQLELFA